MTDNDFNTHGLIRIQRIIWYLFLACFGSLTLLYFFMPDIGERLGSLGVILIGLAILARVVVMAEQFRRVRLPRFSLLCYLLVVLMLGTIVARSLIG